MKFPSKWWNVNINEKEDFSGKKRKRNESWNKWVLKYLFEGKIWIVVVGSRKVQTNKQKDSKYSNSLTDKVKLDFDSENGDAET